MAHARTLEHGVGDGEVRGAAAAAPRTDPLAVVAAAVAGDDIQSVARSASDALGCPVAISLPAFGLSAQWPAGSASTATLKVVADHATALSAGIAPLLPEEIFHAVPVRLGPDVVGVVAALAAARGAPDADPWLHATAAAAAVTALMQDNNGPDTDSSRRAFLQVLELRAPSDIDALLAQGRKLGYDFSHGAVAFSAMRGTDGDADTEIAGLLPDALVAEVGSGRVLGLLPLAGGDAVVVPDRLLAPLNAAGIDTAHATPRRSPADLRDALLESAVLAELLTDPSALMRTHAETYRLLVGVLIRNPDELTQLRTRTIEALEHYDRLHDTDLLATLEAFLAHHGSTTETAEAMSLHRHTVGYRLARVQEVSGLSPYESEGRERLSLGLKAHRIMLAERRRCDRLAAAAPG